jgi:hypothetical protein
MYIHKPKKSSILSAELAAFAGAEMAGTGPCVIGSSLISLIAMQHSIGDGQYLANGEVVLGFLCTITPVISHHLYNIYFKREVLPPF